MNLLSNPENKAYPFHLGWGVFVCFLLVLVVIAVGPYSDHIEFLPDEGILWYYWQLPEKNDWAYWTAWIGYSLHQLFNWSLIVIAQRLRPAYTGRLHPINLWALIGNLFFILLHILQTKFWYDGLAQSTSVLTSQFSVIFLLVAVLIMENPRRGILFGKKAPMPTSVVTTIKRYHGYYFSWAIVFTFWFHPIELTKGHILGLFYIFALMLQGSLFFTRFHRNRLWTFCLEVYVLFHGALVAYLSPFQGADAAAMFITGFLTLMVVTQIHGLGLSRATIVSVIALYVTCVAGLIVAGLLNPIDLFRVPAAEYILAVVVTLVLWFLLAVGARAQLYWRKRHQTES